MHFDSGSPELNEKIQKWLDWDRNEKTSGEIKTLIEKKKWIDLEKRLSNRLTFGTAGLRGVMRAGFDSMNDLVIVQTAQGLCEYIFRVFPDKVDQQERGIVFGYDGRYNSKRFAELSTAVFLNSGVKVWLYSEMVATPFIPFAIMKKNCLAGVMVTASHNPKEDNGYKVYWSNGAQIIPPHDKEIQKAILGNLEPLDASWDTTVLNSSPLLADPFEEMFDTYYTEMLKNIPPKLLESNGSSNLRFVYTAMHGVGYPFVEKAFKVANLQPLLAVMEQRDPDPEFSTVKFPNPEEGKSSLELAIKKADEEGVSIILANDPDADRLACAEKDPKTATWKVFNGNELGALLGWWALHCHRELNADCEIGDCYLLASTVSSKILKSMATIEGFNFIETLTGFKWMGNLAKELLDDNKKVLFAFEEAIGFMFSSAVLDKDGVSAACHLATLACYLKSSLNLSLSDKLKEIYDFYGYHCTNCSYLFCFEAPVIKRIFERIRNFNAPGAYPDSILNGKYKIKYVRDLTTGVDSSKPDGRATLPISASSQMITFTFDNGLVVTLRTSGTEPKIKYYAELCARPDQKDWDALRDELNLMVAAIVEEFFQPKINNLTCKAD